LLEKTGVKIIINFFNHFISCARDQHGLLKHLNKFFLQANIRIIYAKSQKTIVIMVKNLKLK
jgi:hypothetical protein